MAFDRNNITEVRFTTRTSVKIFNAETHGVNFYSYAAYYGAHTNVKLKGLVTVTKKKEVVLEP